MAGEEDWTELTVDEAGATRIDAWLASRLPLSRSRIAQRLDRGAPLGCASAREHHAQLLAGELTAHLEPDTAVGTGDDGYAGIHPAL